MKKCYIYTRVSTVAQTEGYSLDAQEASLRAYADYRELKIVGNYCDAGKSGKNIKGRPAFRQMMTDIISQKDGISFVLVFKLSRFGRNAADILKSLQRLEDFGVDLVSVDEAIDSSTHGGRLTLAILAAVAEMERENINAQFMAGRMQKILDGGWSGGSAPYGYKNDKNELALVPSEAEVVQTIFELYYQKAMPISTVAYELNKRNITRETNNGESKPFTYNFVSHILKNPIYCGRIYYNRRTNKKDRDGKTVIPDKDTIISAKGKHEAIISEEIWDDARERQLESAENHNKSEKNHVYLLAGTVRCPVCGRTLVGIPCKKKKQKGDGYYKPIYYYICRYHTRQNGRICPFDKSLNQEIIDGLVLKVLERVQNYKDFEDALKTAYGDEKNLERTKERLQYLCKELKEAEITKARMGETLDGLNPQGKDYDTKYDRISEKLDRIYDKIEELENDISVTKRTFDMLKGKMDSAGHVMMFLANFSVIYEEMSDEERKEMLRLFIDKVEIFPEDRDDGKIIKSISFRFPLIYDGKPLEKKINSEEMVSFTLDCSNVDLTLSDTGNIIMKKQKDGSKKVIVRKATYPAMKSYILEKYGVKVSSLYIAQIKRKYGLETGIAYNKHEKNKYHVPKCPKQKEMMIMEALKYYGLMNQDVEYMEDAV